MSGCDYMKATIRGLLNGNNHNSISCSSFDSLEELFEELPDLPGFCTDEYPDIKRQYYWLDVKEGCDLWYVSPNGNWYHQIPLRSNIPICVRVTEKSLKDQSDGLCFYGFMNGNYSIESAYAGKKSNLCQRRFTFPHLGGLKFPTL